MPASDVTRASHADPDPFPVSVPVPVPVPALDVFLLSVAAPPDAVPSDAVPSDAVAGLVAASGPAPVAAEGYRGLMVWWGWVDAGRARPARQRPAKRS